MSLGWHRGLNSNHAAERCNPQYFHLRYSQLHLWQSAAASNLMKLVLPQCKHQLAARLGDLLGKCDYKEVPDHTLSNMLMS